MMQPWERIFLEEGAEGLMKNRRGKAYTASRTRKSRPPKLDKKAEEVNSAENQRLRMEIGYLKGIDALVQKRLQDENRINKSLETVYEYNQEKHNLCKYLRAPLSRDLFKVIKFLRTTQITK